MVAENELDALWELPRSGPLSWWEGLPPDLQEWLEAVADRAITKRRLPNGSAVARAIEKAWPEHSPNKTTVRSTLQRLVKERSARRD